MDAPRNIPEEFLQYVWENKLYKSDLLQTNETAEKLEVINQGRRNTDSGPDFFNAKIKIGNTIWIGNIEIHKKASDWYTHKHQNDRSYDNVILHIVETNDQAVTRKTGETIPSLTLKIPEHFYSNYVDLLMSKTWIPCQNQFHKIDPIVLQLGFNRLMIERLETKTEEISTLLHKNKNDWNETFYQMLSRMFGFKTNAVPFQLLTQSLPLRILNKHKNNLFQLEALLFGNSGLLNEQLLGDDYYLKLRNEYSFLYKKYKLQPIEAHLWKFMRLRPLNFPTVRISQLASLIHRSQGLFSKMIEIEDLNQLQQLFKVSASNYWDTHYNFNKPSERKGSKELGEKSANILLINTLIPFLFIFGEIHNKNQLKNRALEFLEKLPAESNSIIKKWQALGIKTNSAFETQALLQLKNYYCETKKCLNCHIGAKLVVSPKNQNV